MKKALLLFLLAFGLTSPGWGQTLLPNGEQTFVDQNGVPLAAGKVYFYIPSTTTPKTTWSDQGETSPNANPVVLDSAGRAVIWGSGNYRQVVKDLFGNTIWDKVTSGGASLVGNITPVDSIASLQALGTTSATIGQVMVAGYYAGSAAGGGYFVWNTTSTVAGNGCTIFAASGVSTGRWVRQGFKTSGIAIGDANGPLAQIHLDPMMCGAYWDEIHDDAAAINTTLVVANTNGWDVEFPAGWASVRSTIMLQPGVNIRGKGMTQTLVDCAGMVNPGTACMWLNLPNNTEQVQAPSITDLGIRTNGTFGIEINSNSATFCDTPGCTDYAMRPHLDRLFIVGGTTAGIACFKCFDGTISGNYITPVGFDYSGTLGTGIWTKGSDIMAIGGDQGGNRVLQATGYSILANGSGTFGNLCKISHNEILGSLNSTGQIFSDCVSFQIDHNFLESPTTMDSDIRIGAGALTGIVEGNWLSSTPANNWLVVLANMAQLTVRDNQTTNPPAQGPARLPALYPFYYNSVTRSVVSHSGNWTEDGFPFNTQSSATIPISYAILDFTPDTYYNFIGTADAGSTVRVFSDTGSGDVSAGAWLLLAGDQVDFTTTPFPIIGTYSICFVASSPGGVGVSIAIQPYDGATPIGGLITTAVPTAGRYCPGGLAGLAASSNLNWTMKNTGAGPAAYIREIYAH